MLDEKKLREDILQQIDETKLTNVQSSKILASYLEKKEAKSKKHSKLLKGLIPSLSFAVVAAIVIPVGIKFGINGEDPNIPPIPPSPVTLAGSNEIAFGVLSAANLSGHIDNSSPLGLRKSLRVIDFDTLDEKVQMINPYMYTAEEMLDANMRLDDKYEVYYNEDVGYESYQYKMIYDDKSTIFYFNESKLPGDNDWDEDEIEEEFRLDGLMLLQDNSTYEVIGSRELEQESDEQEYALNLRIYFDENRSHYLEVKREVEQESNEYEESYKYTRYENGREVSEIELSFEEEDGDYVEIETFDRNSSNVDGDFFVRKVNNSELEIDYTLSNDRSTMQVYIEDEGTNYHYVDSNVNYDKTYARK